VETCSSPELGVEGPIADHVGALDRDREVSAGFVEHADVGFAQRRALAVLRQHSIGVKGTVVERVDRCRGSEPRVERSVEALDIGFAVQAAGHAGLIGHHDQQKTRALERAQPFCEAKA